MTAIFQIDLNLISDKQLYTLSLSPQVCAETAERFKIPNIYNIDIDMEVITQKHAWQLKGHVTSMLQLRCIQSDELFDETFIVPFDVILSQYEIEDDTLDLELIEDLNVDIGDIALQYLALQIPLHPTHPKLASETHLPISDASDTTESHWKKALEQLKQHK
jgi:hypothetical protein